MTAVDGTCSESKKRNCPYRVKHMIEELRILKGVALSLGIGCDVPLVLCFISSAAIKHCFRSFRSERFKLDRKLTYPQVQ